ncbi:MAG: hypothetical protein IPM69_03555 [Ignavibacteria bacterium]|nr:hypothetical protein [Ignavibacteria bacterium]
MAKLTVPIDSQVFIATIELIDRNKRPEYIFENLYMVLGGEHTVLGAYAVEAREYWESRCCSMLEYATPAELYEVALQGKLPKVQAREKDVILRLSRALCDEARLNYFAPSDEIAVNNCYYAEALLKHINHKSGLLRLYIDFPHALRRRDMSHEFLYEIAQKALVLAQETGEKEGELQALNNLGHLSELNNNFRQALEFYQQEQDVLDTIITENGIDDSPNTIPEEYLMPKAVVFFAIGKCKGILGDIRETVRMCNLAAEYAARIEHDDICVHIHLLLARSYNTLGVYHSALQHLIPASSIAKALKSPFLVGQVKMYTAITYSKIGEFERAIEYGLKAVETYKLYQPIAEYLIVCGRVGSIMVTGGELERALELFHNNLKTIEECKQPINLEQPINLDWQKALILRQLAQISVIKQKWDEALAYLSYPLQIVEDMNNLPHLIAETLIIATDAYIGATLFDTAAELAARTLEISLKNNDLEKQYIAHKQLATIAELQQNVSTAYYHYKEFHRLKEQAFNNESDQRSKNMLILLEEKEALRTAQAERLRLYELEEEIAQLSSALVHREQALKEIRTTLRTMKSSNEHAEQVVQVLQSVIRSSEIAVTTNATKTSKLIDETLDAHFPTLSRIQRVLCTYIALGHTTKEIATMMGISVQSAHTQRYRVRLRIGLSSQESLDYTIKQAVKNYSERKLRE